MDTQDITLRRLEVEKIISQLKKENKLVTRYTVHEQLTKKGYKVNPSTVYRDITAINRDNTWVRDLSESNYSSYMEEIYTSLIWAEQESVKQYNKTWTASKTVTKDTPDGQVTERTETEELAAPKNAFLSTYVKTQELKHKMLTGDNINISAALLGKKLNQLKKQTESLEQEKVDVIKLASTK